MMGEKQALVPQLRFPEFLKSGEWEERSLGTQGDFLSSLSGKTAKDFDVGKAKFIPYMNVFSNTFSDLRDLRAVNVTEDESQNAVAKGDVFFTVSSETPEEAGMSSVLLEAIENCYLNSFCAMFRFYNKRSPNPVFLGYWLRSGLVRAHLSRGAQGATRYNISKPVFREVPLLLPPPPEQQKIADCLLSLDALIAAQADKIDALKTHKKGLMQQLFPREGETVPRLRFPEFRDAGEWRYKKAGLLFSNRNEQGQDGLPIYSVTMNDGMAKRDSLDRKIENISESSDNKRAHKHDIIYNMMRMWQGASGVSVEDCMVSPAYVVLAPRNSMCTDFFGYLFKTRRFLHILTAHSQGLTKDRLRLYFKDFAQILLPSPPIEEQRIIAGCLSSLDEAIATQTQKLDTLKAHKKGLMQQLFPNPQAVKV